MAQYPKPTSNAGIFNNQSFVHPDTGGLTIDEAEKYFITFPNTQSPSTIIANNFNTTGNLNVAGDSQFGGDVEFIGGVSITGTITFEDDVEVAGTTTLDDNLLCLSTATITDILTCEGGIDIPTLGDGITFPDNTTQTTAFIEANYAQLNTDNTFLAPYKQTFQQNNSTTTSTASLQINNIDNSDNVAFYIDPSAGNDLTLYSSQSGGGLTVRNPTASFTLNPIVISPGVVGAQSLNTIDMSAQNITGIGALAGNGGNIVCNANLLMGTGVNLNLQNNNIINCNSITDASGQYTTTNTPPDNSITTAIATTGYVATAIANIPPPSGFAVLNQGGTQNWLGNNTCSNGIWDYRTNSSVLVQTVANSTNNNTSASTAFVKANAGVFTQTSFSLNPSFSTYYTLNPTSVSVITTYVSASNTVSFNSVQFVITIATPPTFLLVPLIFSAPPFSGAPPSTSTQYISLYCSNGATYTGQLYWLSATSIQIGISGGGPNLTSGMTFTTNLANLGAFTP